MNMKTLLLALLAIATWPDFATAQAKVSTLSASTGINLNSVDVALQTQVPAKFVFVQPRPKRNLLSQSLLDVALGQSIWDVNAVNDPAAAQGADWFFDLPITYSGGNLDVITNLHGTITPTANASFWVNVTMLKDTDLSSVAIGTHLSSSTTISVGMVLSQIVRTTTSSLAGARMVYLRLRRDPSSAGDVYTGGVLMQPILKVPVTDMNGN